MVYETPKSDLVADYKPKTGTTILYGVAIMIFCVVAFGMLAGLLLGELLEWRDDLSFRHNHNRFASSEIFPFLMVPAWCLSGIFVGGFVGRRLPERWLFASVSVPLIIMTIWLPLQFIASVDLSISQLLIAVLLTPSSVLGGFIGSRGCASKRRVVGTGA